MPCKAIADVTAARCVLRGWCLSARSGLLRSSRTFTFAITSPAGFIINASPPPPECSCVHSCTASITSISGLPPPAPEHSSHTGYTVRTYRTQHHCCTMLLIGQQSQRSYCQLCLSLGALQPPYAWMSSAGKHNMETLETLLYRHLCSDLSQLHQVQLHWLDELLIMWRIWQQARHLWLSSFPNGSLS